LPVSVANVAATPIAGPVVADRERCGDPHPSASRTVTIRGPIDPLLQAMRRLMRENLRMREPRSRRTHVLTLTDTIGMRGAEQIILTLNQSLDPDRFRRTICLTRETGVGDPSGEFDSRGRVQRLRADGVELLQLNRRSRFN